MNPVQKTKRRKRLRKKRFAKTLDPHSKDVVAFFFSVGSDAHCSSLYFVAFLWSAATSFLAVVFFDLVVPLGVHQTSVFSAHCARFTSIRLFLMALVELLPLQFHHSYIFRSATMETTADGEPF